MTEISLMEHCDWSIGQCLQTSNEVSAMLSTNGFKSLFTMSTKKIVGQLVILSLWSQYFEYHLVR